MEVTQFKSFGVHYNNPYHSDEMNISIPTEYDVYFYPIDIRILLIINGLS